MKLPKIICLILVSVLVLPSFGLMKEKEKNIDLEATYQGEIVKVDAPYLLVRVVDLGEYSVIRIRDQQGGVMEGDIIEGKLCTKTKADDLRFKDITQNLQVIGEVYFSATPWKILKPFWDFKDVDSEAEYTGYIIGRKGYHVLIQVEDEEQFAIMQILDKQGFIVEGDTVKGKLLATSLSQVVISDMTQDSKFVARADERFGSWEEALQLWQYAQ